MFGRYIGCLLIIDFFRLNTWIYSVVPSSLLVYTRTLLIPKEIRKVFQTRQPSVAPRLGETRQLIKRKRFSKVRGETHIY